MRFKPISLLLLSFAGLAMLSACGGGSENSSDSSDVTQRSSDGGGDIKESSQGGKSDGGNNSSSPTVIEDPKEYFLRARSKTLAAGYAYSDDFSIETTVGAIGVTTSGPSAHRVGSTAYSPDYSIEYYQTFESSGALLYDGWSHEYVQDDVHYLIKQNEDAEVTSFEQDSASSFERETSTFAKAIFEYESDDIKSVTAVSSSKYKLVAKATASNVLCGVLGNLDSPFVTAFVSALSYVEVEPTYSMYVTFTSAGYIDTYTYTFSADVTIASQPQHMDLTYTLDFSSYQSTNITLPAFEGLSISAEDISKTVSTGYSALSSYKSATKSSYSYKVKSDIEFESGDDYSVTVQGNTFRQTGSDYNFNNYYEVDQSGFSDSEGDDIDDYDGGRGMTSDGSIYDIRDPIGFKKYSQIDASSFDASEDLFYFLFDIGDLVSSNVVFTQTTTDKTGATLYNYAVKDSFTKDILDMVSASTRLAYNEYGNYIDEDEESDATHYDIFGNFTESSLSATGSNVFLTIQSGSLTAIEIELSGSYNTTIQSTSGKAYYELELTIECNDDYETYEIPSDKKNIISSIK